MKISSVLSPELETFLQAQTQVLAAESQWHRVRWEDLSNLSDPLPDLLLLSPKNLQPAQLLQILYPLIRLELPTLVFVDETQQEQDWPEGDRLDFVFAPWSPRSLTQHLKLALKMAQALRERRQIAQEVQHLYTRLEEINPRDPQTGLYNRRCFEERLNEEWRRSHRHALSISLLLLRWVGPISETATARAFPELLRDISPLRCSDLAARLDLTTLAVLLPQTLETGAETVAQGLYHSLLPRAQRLGYELQVGLQTCQPPSLMGSEDLIIQTEATLHSGVFC
ncbi:MAG: diguanylate cyclase [Candidatus Sericytochromatia bacterium]